MTRWRGSSLWARPSEGQATKVARKLKYFSPETDYKALERELVSASSGSEPDDEIDYEELAAKYAVDDDDWDDEDRK